MTHSLVIRVLNVLRLYAVMIKVNFFQRRNALICEHAMCCMFTELYGFSPRFASDLCDTLIAYEVDLCYIAQQ